MSGSIYQKGAMVKSLLILTVLLGVPAFAKSGLNIAKNQSLIDAVLRSSAGATVTCRNGATVNIRHNTASMNGLSFNWQAFATQSSNETGVLLLNLYSREPNDLTYYQLNSICTYSEYPALVVRYQKPAVRTYPRECNPWTNCP